ncbi:MAG: hypothetical protein KAI80_13440, partial [Hyphomicrobiaceae bacterium]|nr:hypothetical protein [Hyphomicrobiaceae bacterium]
AAITRDEALFAAALAGQDEFLASIAEIETRLDGEFELIRKNSEARRKDVEARNADLEKQRQKKGAGSGLDPEAEKEAAKLREEQQKLFDQLVKQRNALVIVAETGREYSEVLVDLKIQSLAAATGNEELGKSTQETADEVRALTEEIKATEEAEQARLDRIDEAADVTLEARDAAQVYADELARLQGLLDDGLITPEVFEASVENLKNLDDATQDFFRRARENSQDILAGFLENGLQDLDDFANQFADMLLKLASQALAAEIFSKILGPADGGGGAGGILGTVLSIFGRQFGGGVQGGQAVSTGEGGRFGAEVFVPNVGGQVVPTGGDRGAAAAPAVNVPVSIVNAFDDSDIVGAFQSGGGDQVVLNMVSKRRQAFRQALGV